MTVTHWLFPLGLRRSSDRRAGLLKNLPILESILVVTSSVTLTLLRVDGTTMFSPLRRGHSKVFAEIRRIKLSLRSTIGGTLLVSILLDSAFALRTSIPISSGGVGCRWLL